MLVEFFIITVVCITFFGIGQAMLLGYKEIKDRGEKFNKYVCCFWGVISLIALFGWPVLVYLVVFR